MKESIDSFIKRVSAFFESKRAVRLIIKVGNEKMITLILSMLFSKIEEVDVSYDVMMIGEDGKSIGVDEVRMIKDFLSYRPSNAKRKYVIIKEMRKASPEAISALLKITEEAPDFSSFIFFTSNLDQIISTVRSRFFILKVAIDPLSIVQKQSMKDVSDPFVKAMISIDPVTFMQETNLKEGEEFAKILNSSDMAVNLFIENVKKDKPDFMLLLGAEKILISIDDKTLSIIFQKLQSIIQSDKDRKIVKIFLDAASLLCEDLVIFNFTSYWKSLSRKMYVSYYMDMDPPSEKFIRKLLKIRNENLNEDLLIFWLFLNFSMLKKVKS
jgi:small nuclear ribonucleoprotein (snRNP)-like protein|uniref:DNA polymerase III subunit delta n=1 Tax=Mesoaciditoga lauensis TaxID=1495039 RepID=A0A7V3RFM3_9BACT